MKTSSGTTSCNSGVHFETGRPDRERERSRFQRSDEHNLEDESATGNLRKYAGIGPESVANYREQSSCVDLELPMSLQFSLAEDISYKLRYVIHDALVKARLSGRNCILSTDIEATFENLSIEKVYGAESSPKWIAFGDQNLTYLDDTVVNLVGLAEEESSYVQPAHVIVTRKWVPDVREVSGPLKKYFRALCFALVSNDLEVRRAALKDVSENGCIGPIVEWFYNFAYFLLSKDIPSDCLTLAALDLIKSLELNPISPQIVSENQLKLLVRLMLHRVLRTATSIDVLRSMCRILAVLADHPPIRELIAIKLAEKMDELKHSFPLAIVTLVNELGTAEVYRLLLPNLDYFFTQMQQRWVPDLTVALLTSYTLVETDQTISLSAKYYGIFKDALVPLWKSPNCSIKAERPETNWRNVKSQLLRSRRRVTHRTRRKTAFRAYEDVFPFDGERAVISFRLQSNVATGRQRFLNMCEHPVYNIKPNSVIVGKRNLAVRIAGDCVVLEEFGGRKRCYDHTMSSVII